MATTSTTETKVYDLYAALLNYKKTISSLKRPCLSSSWIPEEHLRRIKAYDILSAYYDCYSRDFRKSPDAGTTGNNDSVKEVGTPGWLCDKIKNKLLGGTVSINIPTPRRLANVDSQLAIILTTENADPAKKTLLTQKKAEKELLAEREAYLQDWFTENMVALKVDENECICSYLGDCVYLVYWDKAEKIPKIETYDPGFVFPEYNLLGGEQSRGGNLSWEDDSTEVRDRVCLSWQEEVEDTENFKVYREVYELRKNGDALSCHRHAAYYQYPAGSDVLLYDLDTPEIIATTEEPWADLGIPFIPIVIVPNVQIQGNTFGRSNIHKLLPLFDSIMNSETDLSANSEHLGGASVFLSGNDAKPRKDSNGDPITLKVKSNSVYFLGENGKMDLLDTSSMQTALLATLERYDNKLIELSEITDIVAGRSKESQIPSGVALKILLQPLLDKIQPMRQQRQQHYSLLFYYVQILYQLNGNAEEKSLFSEKTKLYDVYLQYGEIIPSEKKAQLDEFKTEGELLDEQTVLEEMKAAGYNIDVAVVMKRRAAQRKEQSEMNRSLFNYEAGAGSEEEPVVTPPEKKPEAGAQE